MAGFFKPKVDKEFHLKGLARVRRETLQAEHKCRDKEAKLIVDLRNEISFLRHLVEAYTGYPAPKFNIEKKI